MRRVCIFVAAVALSAGAADWSASKAQGDRKYEAGDYESAFKQYSDALAAVGPESVEAAGLRLDLAKVWWMRGDYAQARSLDEQALAIYQRAYGAEHTAIARALAAIGMAIQGAGDYAGAQVYLERALEMARRTAGNESADTVDILQKLAFNIARSGNNGRARVVEEEAVAIAERSLGPDHPLTSQGLRVLGQMLVELGDYPGAQRVMERSLAVLENRAGKDAIEVGDLLVSMGNGAKDAGAHKTAEEYFLRAASIYEKRLGPNNTRVGGAVDSLGQTYMLAGRLDDARRALQRALEIQTAELGPRHPWTGNVIQGFGKVEARAGNYAKARELYEDNLDIWREKLGPTHPFTVVTLTLLADVLGRLGEYRAAMDMALNAAAIRRDDIAFTVRSIDEREALRYADLHTASMDTVLTLASRPDASVADRARIWDALIRSRALVLDEMGARHRSVLGAISPELAALAQHVSENRSRMAKLVIQGRRGMPPKEYEAAVEAARKDLEHAELELAQKSGEFRHEKGQRDAGYEDVRAALPAGTALVAFRRYRHRRYNAPGDVGTDSYIAFVLPGPGGEPAVVPLGSAARVDPLVQAWRGEIDRERQALGRAAKANEQRYRTAAAALRAAVWDPVVRQIGTARKVDLVPDGALQLLNFAALPTGEGRYLVETGPLLHVLSAERDLTAPAAAAQGTGMLAVANPEFSGAAGKVPAVYRGGHSVCGDFSGLQFGALPGSAVEVKAILEMWRAQGWQGVEATGAQATEGAVKQMAPGKRVVHIATHGFFLDASCPETSVARENPLLRAGLALAGANRRSTSARDEDDGVLTAEEAASLNLQSAEWVVLSGCDTGVGDIRAGEGVLGLRRAFLEAGARTLIASLWPVGDEDTREWMTSLYRARFIARRGTAESIRAAGMAQLRMRRAAGKTTHPFYWAGFLAVGNWR